MTALILTGCAEAAALVAAVALAWALVDRLVTVADRRRELADRRRHWA